MYEPFEAQCIDGHNKKVIGIEGTMTIESADGYIYITKEQAMKFFGLVEPEFHDGVVNPKWSSAYTDEYGNPY